MDIGFIMNDRRVVFKMMHDPDSIVDNSMKMMANLTGGTCEPEAVHVMTRMVKEGDFVVDIGANVGFFTLLLQRLVGLTGSVLAFEPGPNNIPKFRENMRLNSVDNVVLCERPLWSGIVPVTLYLSLDGGSNSLRKNESMLSSVKLDATTLDSTLTRSPRLIKIDAEGAEYDILSAGERWINSSVTTVLCELNDKALARFGHTIAQLRGLMGRFGYAMFILTRDGSLPILVPWNTTVKPGRENTMVMFATQQQVGEAWPEVSIL